ncbi:hypothetical protein BU25DRAFT_463484 [Macroventuria anomochaeta]|uniref:Uncharacterized protein n=1 Tax=Macroventuria anomochaeta TaxID=301207 RepID=A0ACB6RIU8_9PLEO|nr:uncharacterized protein BU25DRAFT_463484 [Macroventuria anomochaeta]KAF2621694.1 hypothetical protein BU25DRAFT_463484 [Macroventuria anomochaeta]
MDDGEASRAGQRQCSYRVEGAVCPPLDSAVLQRIREGRGPRDTIPEDLLAAFRDNDPQNHSAETYGDLRKVLLSWNDRMSGNLGEDQDAREMLQIAVERRTHLLKSSSHGLDRTHALKESSNELLQALTTLRPEIASFRSQDPFDILIMMWANVRIAIPDLDDELKLLTMKALLNEVESRLHTSNATKVFGLARSLSVARLEQNTAAVERLETKIQAFEQKMRETIVKKAIDRIKLMRKDLLQGKLKELQQLTELQAAQKWDAHAKLGGSQQRQNQSRAYDQANGKLRRVLQQQVPELDAHVQVVQNNANALAGMSASLLSRAMEAGFSLEDKHSSTLVELAKADVKGYVSGTVADVLDAREEAARMLNRMGAVESHLDVLLDAAKSQYREYDGLLRLLDPTESRNTSGDVEIELAEKYGPRRESILLMIRNMQRARRG